MDPEPTDRNGRSGEPAGTRKKELPRLIGAVLAAFVLVEALLLGLGVLITRVLDDTGLHEAETEAENAILESRTSGWNGVTLWGTLAAATLTVIALTAIACLVLYRLGRGPRFAVFLALAVMGETALFLVAAAFIDRDRPEIPQLDAAPPTSSFPSGHTAASIALGFGLVLALYRLGRGHRLLAIGWVLASLYTGFVIFSRLYRGMHWPTDVAASVIFASLWLLLLRAILLPRAVVNRLSSRRGADAGAGALPPLRR
jgi:membrane-associated phospholipid phosphatase